MELVASTNVEVVVADTADAEGSVDELAEWSEATEETGRLAPELFTVGFWVWRSWRTAHMRPWSAS